MTTHSYINNLKQIINNSQNEVYTSQTILTWLNEIEKTLMINTSQQEDFAVDYNCPERTKFINLVERNII